MSHTLNMWGAVIGLLAAVAWVISAVSTIPPLVLGAGCRNLRFRETPVASVLNVRLAVHDGRGPLYSGNPA